jgi:hypothetical protein
VEDGMGILDYLGLLVISILGPLLALGSRAVFFKKDRESLEELLTEKLGFLLLVMGIMFLLLVILSQIKPIHFY